MRKFAYDRAIVSSSISYVLQHFGTRCTFNWSSVLFFDIGQFVVDALSVIRCHFGHDGCYTIECELNANQQPHFYF